MGKVWKIGRTLAEFPILAIDDLFSSRNSMLKKNQVAISSLKNGSVLIYVHFSTDNQLKNWELDSLRYIKSLGIDICLVINEDVKSKSNLELQFNVDGVFDFFLLRHNHGRDLAAYRDAFNYLRSNGGDTYQKFIFMNNSVLWFPNKIAPYIEKVTSLECDLVVASISNQFVEHIQTYFFSVNSKDGVAALEEWFDLIKNWRMKKNIVRKGELRTSILLKRQLHIKTSPDHLTVNESVFSKYTKKIELEIQTSERLDRVFRFYSNGEPFNRSHELWLENIELGFPGIKFDLLLRNPTRIPDHNLVVRSALTESMSFEELFYMFLKNPSVSLITRIRRKLLI